MMEVLEPRESAQGSDYGSIPDELKQLDSWVCWKLESRRDKNGVDRLDKVPYSPNTNSRASTADSETWASYEAALATFERGQYNGIGFVLSDEDDYVFLDLDKCIGDEGVSEFAAWVLEEAVSYTEVSQSGKGLHIIVRGRKPGDACKNSALSFEMYETGRFCAMTGDVYEGRITITACDEVLERVYRRVWPNVKQRKPPRSVRPRVAVDCPDEDVLKRAQQASDGERFERLWAGEWEAEVGSQSEADAALCSMLLRAAKGDVEQTDALFRQSVSDVN
jgi:putative DNA primase/helicase